MAYTYLFLFATITQNELDRACFLEQLCRISLQLCRNLLQFSRYWWHFAFENLFILRLYDKGMINDEKNNIQSSNSENIH